MATQLAGLPDPASHKTPPATAAREALLERLRNNQTSAAPAPAPVESPEPEGDPLEAKTIHAQLVTGPEIQRPAPQVRRSASDMLESLLQVKTPEEVFMMVLERMPANNILTTKVGKWNIEMRAISCTVDDTQLNFVADKRKNQCLPDEIGGEYKISFLSKEYKLTLLGVSFFPSPTSPFVLVSFLRMDEPHEEP
jgi:hypothetical protein